MAPSGVTDAEVGAYLARLYDGAAAASPEGRSAAEAALREARRAAGTGASLRAGVVSTVRGAGAAALRTWVRYHLAAGFDALFVYVDDPGEWEEAGAAAGGDERVRLTRHDAELRAEWRALSLWPRFGPHADAEVQARQLLNAEHAVGLALGAGVAWLLHIDADELFLVPDAAGAPTAGVRSHFASLEADGVAAMCYANLEGVPERADVSDAFEEVTLFRQHLSDVAGYNPALMEPSAGVPAVPCRPSSFGEHWHEEVQPHDLTAALLHWQQRSPQGQYFVGYDNGKAAVRVLPGARPVNVHEWLPALPELYVDGCTNIRLHAHRGALAFRPDAPRVLHYNSCGFGAWRRKYELLGRFEDAWFGGRIPIAPGFHRDSRDAVSSGDSAAALAFYVRRAVLDDPRERDRQLEAGLCVRRDPLALLRGPRS